jgi:translation initiation factor 2B subunit (eIF-2B alpha/beta/delta family)
MWPAARIDALAADREERAGALARRAVEILVDAAEAGTDAVSVARALAAARPSMGAVAGAVGRIVAAAPTPVQVVQEGRALLEAYERASRPIAVLLQPLLAGRVLTHSPSAAVIEALDRALVDGWTRAQPGAEGAAVAAADVVLVGADIVFLDGSIVSAAGTCAVAEAAAQAGLPVVAAAETLTLVPADAHDPEEELFELTPAELLTTIVTEEGAFAPQEVASLIDRIPFLRQGYELVAPVRV